MVNLPSVSMTCKTLASDCTRSSWQLQAVTIKAALALQAFRIENRTVVIYLVRFFVFFICRKVIVNIADKRSTCEIMITINKALSVKCADFVSVSNFHKLPRQCRMFVLSSHGVSPVQLSHNSFDKLLRQHTKPLRSKRLCRLRWLGQVWRRCLRLHRTALVFLLL